MGVIPEILLGPASHYPLDLFLYGVKEKKHLLTHGLTPDENGRYSITEGKLEQTISDILELYAEYLPSNDRIDKLKNEKEIIFSFENLITNFFSENIEKIYDKNNDLLNQNFKNKTPFKFF